MLTGGGDAPGLNAVIRAVVKSASNCHAEIVAEDSFDGLIGQVERACSRRATSSASCASAARFSAPPIAAPLQISGRRRRHPRLLARCIERFLELKLDALIVIGGDGTLAIAYEFHRRGLPIVGVPKTIDNDIVETTNTFGFDTAVAFATDAIDRLHTTAEAHHRIMIVEVMGRYAGWIALYAGVAGGADVVLIPEIPFDIDKVAAHLRVRDAGGARFSIVVVAEGARPVGGSRSVGEKGRAGIAERLGGVGESVADALETLTGKEARHVVLGHLQRGGAPTSFDRMLATRFGARAVELALAGEFGGMVAFAPPDIVAVPLERVVGRTRNVPVDFDVVRAARALGMSMGD